MIWIELKCATHGLLPVVVVQPLHHMQEPFLGQAGAVSPAEVVNRRSAAPKRIFFECFPYVYPEPVLAK